jgi:hypothetical protein
MSHKYRLFVPKQAVGANLVYFDLFNDSDSELVICHVHPIVSGAVAVVGTLGVDLFLTYTTAVGTGGTAATYNGTSLTAATFTTLNPKGQAVDANITARLTPTGGATAGAVITWGSVFTEETAAATYMGQMAEMLKAEDDKVVVPSGTGIRVVQGAVASVGNIGFDVGFDIR